MTRQAAVLRPQAALTVSAVVTICSSRKTATAQASLADLQPAPQAQLAAAWLARVRQAPAQVSVANLYGGRGFALAKRAAQDADARLFVISAGLGLIPSDATVPPYALTVAAGPDSVAQLTAGRFDADLWFRSVSSSPFALRWESVFANTSGCVLVALTRPYARMVGAALTELAPADRARLRLFGVGLGNHLPEVLTRTVMPYDERLDAITPGTKADFAQRALADFAANVAPSSGDASPEWHAEAVEARFKDTVAPVRPDRPRRTDAEIEALIRTHLKRASGIQRLLRALRDEDSVACEQARFRRLYWKAYAAEGLA